MSRRRGGARGVLVAGLEANRRRPRPLRSMRRRGWEEGVLGGDPKWMAAGAFAGSVWLIQWAWRKEPEVVYRTKLMPGESVVVSANAPQKKRGSKRSR